MNSLFFRSVGPPEKSVATTAYGKALTITQTRLRQTQRQVSGTHRHIDRTHTDTNTDTLTGLTQTVLRNIHTHTQTSAKFVQTPIAQKPTLDVNVSCLNDVAPYSVPHLYIYTYAHSYSCSWLSS